MFSLAASAGSNANLLSPLSNTLNSVGSVGSSLVGTVGNTVNTLTAPQGVVCQVLCSVTNPSSPPQAQQNPIGNTLHCLSGTSCSVTDPNPNNNRSTNNSSTSTNGSSTIQQPAQNPAPAGAGSSGHGTVDDPPALTAPSGVVPPGGSLTVPPPPSITLPTATSGINFGKAPFLWPLFLGLDVLGAGAVVLALRKTWSRPVAD